jgi:hypothetical protein
MNFYPEIVDTATAPFKQVHAGGVNEGGAFVFYLRPRSKSEVASTELRDILPNSSTFFGIVNHGSRSNDHL